MQLKHSLFALLIGSLLGCSNMTSGAGTDSWMVDDGVLELTPVYLIQHVQGQPYSKVFAAFNSNANKKRVRLRAGDSITVNGQVLQGVESDRNYHYEATSPVVEGTFTLTVTRASQLTMTHSFELPELGISVLPKEYRPYEKLRVPVQYVVPPKYVKDTIDISIHAPELRFDLISTKLKEGKQYEDDRLPDIQDGSIVFRHIIERAPPPGTYPADIFRQNRIILSEVSDASRSGWITLSNGQPFTIDVK